MKHRRLLSRMLSLRELTASIFALVAILPLLIVVAFVSPPELMGNTVAPVALLLALLIAVFGFMLLRRAFFLLPPLVDRILWLAQAAEEGKLAELAEGPKSEAAKVSGLGSVAEISQMAEGFTRLYETVRGSAGRLEDLVLKLGALNQMVELAASIPKMQDLLALVLEWAMRAVKATVGSIMLLDRDCQTLRIRAARGLPDDVVAGTAVCLGEGIAGKVAQLGQAVLVDDIETDLQFTRANDPKYANGSLICMPIRAADRVIGVINLAKKSDDPGLPAQTPAFSATDLQFLNAFMTYIGYAVDNARLLEDAQQSTQQLEKTVEDLKATQAQLVQAETLRTIGELASHMAHHLHNLLAVVVGWVRILQGQIQEQEIGRVLRIVERSAMDGTEIVRRLRGFSKAPPLSDAVPVDLNTVVQDVLKLTQPLCQDRARVQGIQIEVRLDPKRIPAVTGDAVSLREVLMNLVLNAIDALPDGGTITVRTFVSDGQVHCSVADTGLGMSEEVRRQALEPFFTTKGVQSTGLGLSIAYGIIKRHRGELTVESAEERGTAVTIRLPVAPAASVGGLDRASGSDSDCSR